MRSATTMLHLLRNMPPRFNGEPRNVEAFFRLATIYRARGALAGFWTRRSTARRRGARREVRAHAVTAGASEVPGARSREGAGALRASTGATPAARAARTSSTTCGAPIAIARRRNHARLTPSDAANESTALRSRAVRRTRTACARGSQPPAMSAVKLSATMQRVTAAAGRPGAG